MELWTLGELTDRVGAALADYPGQVNGRVRAVPDQRAIRWYTTIGLIDRPTEMRGRTALYSHRHLLQLVAVKRRQSQGRTLAEIQTELTGATNETLHPIAALPTPSTTAAAVTGTGNPSATAPSATATTPSTATTATATPGDLTDGSPADPRQPSRPRFWADHQRQPQATDSAPTPEAIPEAPEAAAAVVAAVRLADGVTVVLDWPGAVADPARLAAAAAPLLAELTRQGLLSRSSGDET